MANAKVKKYKAAQKATIKLSADKIQRLANILFEIGEFELMAEIRDQMCGKGCNEWTVIKK
jgi:hypothetical protein